MNQVSNSSSWKRVQGLGRTAPGMGARALMEGTDWYIISAEGLYQDLGTGAVGKGVGGP